MLPDQTVRLLQLIQARLVEAKPLEVKKPENKYLIVQGLQDTLRLHQLCEIYIKNDPGELAIMTAVMEDMPPDAALFRMAIDAVIMHRKEIAYKNGGME